MWCWAPRIDVQTLSCAWVVLLVDEDPRCGNATKPIMYWLLHFHLITGFHTFFHFQYRILFPRYSWWRKKCQFTRVWLWRWLPGVKVKLHFCLTFSPCIRIRANKKSMHSKRLQSHLWWYLRAALYFYLLVHTWVTIVWAWQKKLTNSLVVTIATAVRLVDCTVSSNRDVIDSVLSLLKLESFGAICEFVWLEERDFGSF